MYINNNYYTGAYDSYNEPTIMLFYKIANL